MSSHPSFIPRQGLVVNPGASPKQDWLDHSSPPKMFMFGGGYIGFQVGSNKKVRSNPLVLILSLQQNAFDFTVHQSVWLHGWILLPGRGWVDQDKLWRRRRRGVDHGILLFARMGGWDSVCMRNSCTMWLYLSWWMNGHELDDKMASFAFAQAQTIVDRKTKYIGVWGHSLVTYNTTSGAEVRAASYLRYWVWISKRVSVCMYVCMYWHRLQFPGNIYFIAGTYTGLGEFSSRVFVNLPGIYCDLNGEICSGKYVNW